MHTTWTRRAGKTWPLEELAEPPRIHPAPGMDRDGVKAMFYEGLPFRGKPTRVFAYFGAPIASPDTKLPAMVLVHGGGGTAFADWVKLWNSRGYAALAMDLDGRVPEGTYNNWQRHEWAGPIGICDSGHGGFDQTDWPLQDQWPYHAVADVVLAHSLIRSFPGIDAERIGITGISWGGYLTCIVSGVDRRFQFAVPVYGCGFLGHESYWVPEFEKMGKEKAGRWLANWDPAEFLPFSTMPMLWVTGTNDLAYPMNSLQKSYRRAKGPRSLCIRVNMPHGHGGPGENPLEIKAFADSFLKGRQPLARIVEQGRTRNAVWARYESHSEIKQAELIFTRDTGPWKERKWETAPAELNTRSRRVEASLPSTNRACYFNLVDERDLVVSTEHVAAEG